YFALTARRKSLSAPIRAGNAAKDDLVFKLAGEHSRRDLLALFWVGTLVLLAGAEIRRRTRG
ncbi:MAG: hypothetical protein ACT4O2_02270, partial [Beijerinckiaceae bacterium]